MASDSNVYFDQRTYRRHIKSGRLTEAEYTAHLEGLPDASENIMAPEEGGDDDGYEARLANKDDSEAEAAAEVAAPAAPADPFGAAPLGAPAPAPAAPVAPPVAAPSVNDAPAPPPPPLEVPIGAAPIIPPKVD
jgi:hypothetical protein